MLLYLELLSPYCPSTLSAEKCVVKSVTGDPSTEYSKAQRDATAGLGGGERTINQEKILESAAKHMTEETHGRERKRQQKQRTDRRTETIQVTHLLTKRIASITQQKRMRLPIMSTDESLWIRSVGVNQPEMVKWCVVKGCFWAYMSQHADSSSSCIFGL